MNPCSGTRHEPEPSQRGVAKARACASQTIETAGAGAPWLTLVHGATQNRTLFGAQIECFAPRWRLLLIDLAGHGDSAALPGPYGPVEYARGVEAALDAHGIQRTHYWGTHTGTAVALVLAVRSPERFASLILEGAVIPGRHVESIARCYERARVTSREHGLDAAREEWFRHSPWFAHMRRAPRPCRTAAHRAMLDDFSGAPWFDESVPKPMSLDPSDLARIQVPALVYNGEHDVADFLPAARELEDRLPDVRREIMPDTGGFPLWEAPQVVNARVAAYLEALVGRRP